MVGAGHPPHWFSSEQSLQSQTKSQSSSAALLQLLMTMDPLGRTVPAMGETTGLKTRENPGTVPTASDRGHT